jgi:hypothetical protein
MSSSFDTRTDSISISRILQGILEEWRLVAHFDELSIRVPGSDLIFVKLGLL